MHALPSGLRTTTPRIDGMRARFPRFPHPPPPLRRCLWEGWEGRPRPHPPAAPGPSHSERARARFPRFPQDPTAIPAALRPTDPRHNAPAAAGRRRRKPKPAANPPGLRHRRITDVPCLTPLHSHGESTGRTGQHRWAKPSESAYSRSAWSAAGGGSRRSSGPLWDHGRCVGGGFAFYSINFGWPIRREYQEAPVPQAPVVDQYPDGWP